jgi:hypothetical protein
VATFTDAVLAGDVRWEEILRHAARGMTQDMPPAELCRRRLERGFSRTVCRAACEDRPKLKSA